jgi:hypothetical protein
MDSTAILALAAQGVDHANHVFGGWLQNPIFWIIVGVMWLDYRLTLVARAIGEDLSSLDFRLNELGNNQGHDFDREYP